MISGISMKLLSVIIASFVYLGASDGIGSNMEGMGSNGGMEGYIGMGEGGMEDTEGECCPMKKIWGSMDPAMDGWYVNVGKKNPQYLPWRCNSPCIYTKKGNKKDMQYCFANSMTSQSYCDAMDDGEEPVDMGSGGYGIGSEDPVDMGSGNGSDSGGMSGGHGES